VRAIREHLRDFIAITVLVVFALLVTFYIVQEQRLRVPILEEKPFELKAEFSDAGAVVPGQGQTIQVAGVRIGDVQEVELEEGRAVVTFAVDREFLPIYKDATILLRPKTGLEDMFFQMDPGTERAGEVEEGATLPVENTAPDVELHEILEALDADTQAYLRLLLVGAGKGLDGRGRDLGELLGSLGPINRDLERLNRKVAERKENLRRLITNFNRLTLTVGRAEDDLAELITSSNASLGAIAEQDLNVQRTVSLLPGTLAQARETLNAITPFANELGPTFNELRPFARNLPELNASTEEFANAVTPVIRSEIRPFVRTARGPVPDLNVAAKRIEKTSPRLRNVLQTLNRLANMAAFNPGGAEPPSTPNRNEGYLYWAAWLGHNSNSIFSVADGNGLQRRIYLTASCANIGEILASNALAPIVTGFGPLFDAGGPCDATTGGGGLPLRESQEGADGGSAAAEPSAESAEPEPAPEAEPQPQTEETSSTEAPAAVTGP
jgi:phospholipid/cholesterol/gamma-HCH transport system substrate-binding protein